MTQDGQRNTTIISNVNPVKRAILLIVFGIIFAVLGIVSGFVCMDNLQNSVSLIFGLTGGVYMCIALFLNYQLLVDKVEKRTLRRHKIFPLIVIGMVIVLLLVFSLLVVQDISIILGQQLFVKMVLGISCVVCSVFILASLIAGIFIVKTSTTSTQCGRDFVWMIIFTIIILLLGLFTVFITITRSIFP